MNRTPEDVVNFAPGPAKLPKEVTVEITNYYCVTFKLYIGTAGSTSGSSELGGTGDRCDG